VDRYVASLKKLQDALGRFQDASAGRALFEARAAQDAGAWFAVGWLTLREEELARDCARACRRMEKKARPFWD
jgi:CHAD domain-containing protein